MFLSYIRNTTSTRPRKYYVRSWSQCLLPWNTIKNISLLYCIYSMLFSSHSSKILSVLFVCGEQEMLSRVLCTCVREQFYVLRSLEHEVIFLGNFWQKQYFRWCSCSTMFAIRISLHTTTRFNLILTFVYHTVQLLRSILFGCNKIFVH